MTKYNSGSSEMPAAQTIKQEYHNGYGQQAHPGYGFSAYSQQNPIAHPGQNPHQTLQNFFSRFNAVGDASAGNGGAASISANGSGSSCNYSHANHHPAELDKPLGMNMTPSPIYTTDYDDENSSLSSEEHVLAPLVCSSAQSSRPCLTWACKACKKKSVTVDRRKAATMRERRRLRKVGIPCSHYTHFQIYQILKTYCAITTDTNTALSSFNHSLKEWFTLKVDFWFIQFIIIIIT